MTTETTLPRIVLQYARTCVLVLVALMFGCQESLPPRIPPLPVLVPFDDPETFTVSVVPHDVPFPYYTFDTIIYARVSVYNGTDEVVEDSADVVLRATIRSSTAPWDSVTLAGNQANLLWPAYVQNGRFFILPHDTVTLLVPWLDPFPPYAGTQRWANGKMAWDGLPTHPAFDNHGNRLPYDITDTLVLDEDATVRLFNFEPPLEARPGRIAVVYHLWPNPDHG